jgi:predicted transcriptional regulator
MSSSSEVVKMPLTKYRLARLQRDLTQMQLSKITGVPQPVISMVERGMITKADYMGRLQRALGLAETHQDEIRRPGGHGDH